jgi:ATPase subunit of ABC transporter with duplicated ATPase domains
MLEVGNVSLQFGGRILFKDVSLSFLKGNCYGIIGANGAGKSTFLKILSGEIEPTKGDVFRDKKERMSILKQDQNAFNAYTAVDTVMLGFPRIKLLRAEIDNLYAKPDFDEKDGIKAAEMESEYGEMGGYEAEANARSLLNALGIKEAKQDVLMKDLDGKMKVKILLAQALFGNPDILILDEPTNNLDAVASHWLENFLFNFENTVIIVSHDRHFLNKVCTRILDVDYGKISMYIGNYDFWYESSQLILKQSKDENSKKEGRMKELQEFIARFSANASKSKQATSRKKELEKITLEDLKPSSRRYPFIDFKFDKDLGQDVLTLQSLSKKNLIPAMSLSIHRGEKIAVLSDSSQRVSTFFEILLKIKNQDDGIYKWGITVTPTYLPQDNSEFFKERMHLVDWLRPYSKDQTESYLRGWLGRMLFSGEEALKPVTVLSGGEKVRCMFARMMLTSGNVLIMDEPTNHLDLEAITALNKGMINYKGVILFTSHDHELLATVANRIIYITEDKVYDKRMSYDDFIDWAEKEGVF